MRAIQDLNASVRATEDWIDDLMRRLGWHDRERIYLALLAALHALRDCLPRDEAVYVGAHLPALLRGLYYEGWHPGGRGSAKSRSAFLERIHDGVHRDPAVDAEQVDLRYLPLTCLRQSSRTPKPPRQSRCTPFGQAERSVEPMSVPAAKSSSTRLSKQQTVRIFLCGDVMTGRGIDQILAQPCDPILHETYA